MIKSQASKIIYDLYSIFSKNNPNESYEFENKLNNANTLLEVFNINSDKIFKIWKKLKLYYQMI